MGVIRSQEEMDGGGMPPEPEPEAPMEEVQQPRTISLSEHINHLEEINSIDDDYEKLMEQIRDELRQ